MADAPSVGARGIVRAMLTPESRDLLQFVAEELSQPDPYPDAAGIDDQEDWTDREEAESALAGLIATALAGGRVDRQILDEAHALVRIGGTRSDPARVAAAFRVLAQAI